MLSASSPFRGSAAHSRVAPARCRAGAPSEPCVPLVAAHGSGKPLGCCGLKCWFPVLAGVECPLAGCVHETGLVTVGGAGSSVVGEIAGGYRPAGDSQPPLFPLPGGLGWLVRRQQVVPAEWAVPVLPGEQAQGVPVQRGPCLSAPFGPVARKPDNRFQSVRDIAFDLAERSSQSSPTVARGSPLAGCTNRKQQDPDRRCGLCRTGSRGRLLTAPFAQEHRRGRRRQAGGCPAVREPGGSRRATTSPTALRTQREAS